MRPFRAVPNYGGDVTLAEKLERGKPMRARDEDIGTTKLPVFIWIIVRHPNGNWRLQPNL